MQTLQYISIILEAVAVVVAILIAIGKKGVYGWGFALTFAIYVYYDYARLVDMSVSENLLYIMFFIATLSALGSLLWLYRKG